MSVVFVLVKWLVVHFDVFWKLKDPDEISLESLNNRLIVTVSIPNGDLVTRLLHLDDDAIDIVLVGELLSDKGKDEVLPEFVGIPFRYSNNPSATVLVSFIFPHGFHSLDELNVFWLSHINLTSCRVDP
jgi:hypothetical protein